MYQENREFQIILLGSFISQIGSHFLTLALASYVLITTGSAINSGMVFVVTYLPSILVGSVLGGLVDRHISKRLLILNESLSVLVSLAAGACIRFSIPILTVIVILIVRSLLMFVGKSASIKWIKITSSPETQQNRIKYYFLTFFVSTAVSGLLATQILQKLNIWHVAIVDSVSFAVAIVTFSFLNYKVREQDRATGVSLSMNTSLKTLTEIMTMSSVRNSLLLVCLSQSLFQGAYSAYVSFIPVKNFAYGLKGVGYFQLAASVGIIGGFVIVWFFPKLMEEDPNQRIHFGTYLAFGLAGLCVWLASSTTYLLFSLFCFSLFNVFFECIWLHYSAAFFSESPRAEVGRYQFSLTSLAAFLMSLSTLAYSAAAQAFGSGIGTIVVFSLTAFLSLAVVFARIPVHLEFEARK